MKKILISALLFFPFSLWSAGIEHISEEAASASVPISLVHKTGYRPAHAAVSSALEGVLSRKSAVASAATSASAAVAGKGDGTSTSDAVAAVGSTTKLGALKVTPLPSAAAFSATPVKIKVKPITQLAGIDTWPAALIYDQGALGSCTANALAFILRYLSVRNSSTPSNFLTNPQRLDISRLYQYYNTRYYEGALTKESLLEEDSGSSLSGAILALDKYGCTPESFSGTLESVKSTSLVGRFAFGGWPYDIRAFSKQPSPEAYRQAFDPDFDGINVGTSFAAVDSRTNRYSTVAKSIQYTDLATKYRKSTYTPNTPAEQTAIIQNFVIALSKNQPIYFGTLFDVTALLSPEASITGYVPMAPLSDIDNIAGHAIVLVGYGPYNATDRTKNYFKFVNSWGSSWGAGGFGFLTEEQVANINLYYTEAFSMVLPK